MNQSHFGIPMSVQKPMTGLTLDIVATRNIARNEEVFVDFSN